MHTYAFFYIKTTTKIIVRMGSCFGKVKHALCLATFSDCSVQIHCI